ncbi:MAG: acyl--CoA ligase [Microthrixaceae bacterium]|nr:acyl--CoA ligase [Microthrixaceae bacterium]
MSDTGTLTGALRGAAQRFGDARAFVDAARWSISFAALDRASDEAAAGLATKGVAEGSVAALLLGSTVDYVVAYAALAKLGAVTAGVNPRFTRDEQRRCLEVVRPDVVLTADAVGPDTLGAARGALVLEVPRARSPEALLRGLRADGATPPPLSPDPDRPVAIVLTSGTTGRPKGAVFTDRQHAAIVEIDTGGAWGGGGPMLAGTELAHVGFMTKLPWYLRKGHTLHLLDRWRAAEVLRLVEETGMTSVGGVAPQIALLLAQPDFDERDLRAVQALVVGGGPSPPALVEEARRRFGAAYSIRYSSTESGGVGTATAFDADDDEALHTVGRPRAGIELAIRDEQGRDLPDGEIGEVCLRSGAVMAAYWRDPQATAATLVDGWLRTGDLGVRDPDGCLRLAGRRKEMYIRGGYNVYPMEVESVLASHPGVTAVAVAPRPDPVMGEIGVAVVVPRDPSDPPTLASLRSFGGARLSAHKLPEALRLVDDLPLTTGQKVDRRALADREATGAGAGAGAGEPTARP